MLSTAEGFLLGLSVRVSRTGWWLEAGRALGTAWPGASSSLPGPPGLRLARLRPSPRVPLLLTLLAGQHLG